MHGGVAQGELRRADGVALHTDAEHLALDAGLDLVEIIRLGQDLVDGLLIAHSRPEAVGRNVLEAVARPDIHRAGLTQLVCQILRNAHARLAVVNPEAPRGLIGRAQRQRVAFGMGEKRRIEVRTEAVLFAKFRPRRKVLRLQPVPVGPLAVLKNGIAGVKIQLLCAGAELQDFLDVCHQLLRRSRAAGIIAGGLDAARERLGRVGVKAAHVVALPAVQGNRRGFQLFQRRFDIDFQGFICFLCLCVAHWSASI